MPVDLPADYEGVPVPEFDVQVVGRREVNDETIDPRRDGADYCLAVPGDRL